MFNTVLKQFNNENKYINKQMQDMDEKNDDNMNT